MESPESAATIGMKIIGVLVAILTFRWLVRLYAGEDRRLQKDEFKEFTMFILKIISVILFSGLAVYMIYKEGNRTQPWPLYGEVEYMMVFIPLLTIFHLEKAIELIVKNRAPATPNIVENSDVTINK